MGKTRVSIKPNASKAFPWSAKVGIHTWVFETVDQAKRFMTGRFGDCIFTVRETPNK